MFFASFPEPGLARFLTSFADSDIFLTDSMNVPSDSMIFPADSVNFPAGSGG